MTAPVGVRVAAVHHDRDSLLLVRRGPGPAGGTWELPGAAVGPGETLAEAVVRGADASVDGEAVCGPFLGWLETPGEPEHLLVMCFELVVLGPTGRDDEVPGSLPAEPVAEVRRVPLWEVPELALAPGQAEFLADLGIIDLMV